MIQVESLTNTTAEHNKKYTTGLQWFDGFLSGGLVAGKAYLLAGKPGAGKSSLLLQVAYNIARQDKTVLYISGEETTGSVRATAERLQAVHSNIIVSRCMNEQGFKIEIENIQELCNSIKPVLLIIDSLQMLTSNKVKSKHLEYCSENMVLYCQKHGITMIMINHSTKTDLFAGTQRLQHMMDTNIGLDINTETKQRRLYSPKNRTGSTENDVILTMGQYGLVPENNNGYTYNITSSTVNNITVGTTGLIIGIVFALLKFMLYIPCLIIGGLFGLFHGVFIAKPEKRKR